MIVAVMLGMVAGEPPVNFQDHVRPVLVESCLGCHRGSRARNGLRLESVASIVEGGSSGRALVPGDPDGSLMYQVIAHRREPFMPLDGAKLPDETIVMIQTWIAEGARETADSAPAAGAAPRPVVAVLLPEASAEPAAVLPAGLRVEPFWWSEARTAVTALAAAPGAPLVAIGGHKQVSLHHLETLEVLGVLEFPEGAVQALRFSPHGSVLIAGGGRGGDSGRVVGWNVADGARLFALGAEPDAVLAADVSEDHHMVALGGPDRVARVYAVSSGASLYEITKHTDWITALAFSPDGVLLATGDRSGGLVVWEADTGREFHALPAQGGPVTALSWRSDSMVLATAADDGAIRLFEMENGGQVASWSAHGGVLDLRFARDGRLLSAGRDRLARLWQGGGQAIRDFGPLDDLATVAAIGHDGTRVIVGGADGTVRVFDAAGGQLVGELDANPLPSAGRAVTAARAAVAAARLEHETAAAGLAEAEADLAQRTAALAVEEQVAAAARQALEAVRAAVAALEPRVAAARAEVERLDADRAERERAIAALEAEAAAARTEAQEAADAMAAAARQAVDAEAALRAGDAAARPGLEQALHTARRLADGAAAVAQLAAARAAGVEIDLLRAQAEHEHRNGLDDPVRSGASALADEFGRARTDATQKETGLQQLELRLGVMRTEHLAAQEATAQAKARHEASAGQLATAEAAERDATAHWTAMRGAIAAAEGRVPTS